MADITLANYTPKDIDLASRFLQGLKPNTRAIYQHGLDKFAEFLGVSSGEAAAWMLQHPGQTTLAVMDYLDTLGHLAPNTINQRLASLRRVVSLARQLNLIDWTLSVPGPRSVVYRDTRGPGEDATWKIIDATKNVEVRLIVRLCYQMGLRRTEVHTLNCEHIEENAIWVLEKKKYERTLLTMPTEVMEDMSAVRGTRIQGPLFLGKSGRVSTRTINRWVSSAGQTVGLSVTPHGFRHTGITTAARRTHGDAFKVQSFSRHAKLDTVKIYIDHERDDYGEVANLLGRKE